MFDPFAVLGLMREYCLDLKDLERAYFEAQKKNHPDQFARATIDERTEAARKSAYINQAYSLLKDPLKRAEYLLSEAPGEPVAHDPLFLRQVMEWKEQLNEGGDIHEEILQVRQALFEDLSSAFKEEEYETARGCLYKIQYLLKIESPLSQGCS